MFGIRQTIGDRPDHQGQRRAEFMADVVEKLGLGTPDFSQLFFESADIRNMVRHVLANQAKKFLITVVERQSWTDSQDEKSRQSLLACEFYRKHVSSVGPLLVRGFRQRGEEVAESIDSLWPPVLVYGSNRPVAFRRRNQINGLGCSVRTGFDPGCPGQGCARSVGAGQINQRKRNIIEVSFEYLRRGRSCLGSTFDLFGAQLPKQLKSSLSKHARGRLLTGAEDSTHSPALIASRTVGERKVGLFEEPCANHEQRQVFGPCRSSSCKDVLGERANHVPNLGPLFTGRPAQVLGVLHRPG